MTPFKVLIVDDEPDLELLIRQRFRKKIKDGEFEFVFARNGQEALDKLESDPAVRIVMTDINMPVMDGLTLLTKLQELRRTLKAVIVSAYGDMENIRIAMNRGAYDFLTKPIDFQDFELTLQKTIQELEAAAEGMRAQEHLSATLKIATELSSELQLGPLLRKIMATITKMVNAERSTLFLNDAKKHELYTEVGEGLGRTEIRIPNTSGIAGAAFSQSCVINLSDPKSDPRFNAEIDRSTGFQTRSLLCVPLVNKQGKTIGVTQVLNKIDGAFTVEDESRLRAFSSQISVALENATLFEDVQSIKNYNESILESMSSGVVTVNEDGVVVTCNAAGRRILRVRSEDIVQKPIEEFFVENPWLLERFRQVEETRGQNVTMDAEIQRGGKNVSANVTILPLVSSGNKRSGSMIMIDDITTEKRMKSTMSRYMDPSVVERLLNSGEDALGGQSRVASVLFADIRDFTKLSEALGAQETVRLLNEFFTVMVDCVQKEEGMLDKFIGDALMAEFGIPLEHDDDEDRAVRTAILMHTELAVLNRRLAVEGKTQLGIRVGINTDAVISGNIGSPKRMDYTVMGDGVNLASRLEGACKEYGAGIIVSESTFRKLRGHYRAREVDRVVVYGKSEPVGVFEILEHHTEKSFPELTGVLSSFADGLQYYRERQWDRAIEAFTAALRLNPRDSASSMFVKRCEYFRIAPPPEDWKGVWVMKSK